MSKQAYIRASVAMAATKLFPKIVREALISDAKFMEEYGISSDAVLCFGDSGVTFQRSVLLEAVRLSFDTAAPETTVIDMKGQVWDVQYLRDEVPRKISLAHQQQRFSVVHLALLAPERDTRLGVFRGEASRVFLPLETTKAWEELLHARPPSDDDLGFINDDLNDTPIVRQSVIREHLKGAVVLVNVLVPRSQAYYARLVGKYEESLTLDDYVVRVATPHMERLVKQSTFEGYQQSLLLGAQPQLSAALGTLGVEIDELAKVFDWLGTSGDAMSRSAAIEVGLAQVGTSSIFQESLSRLVAAIVTGEPAPKTDPIRLLSSLFMFVYGEIAHTRTLASMPPFWRRLAALAHAALIARCVIANEKDADGLIEWLGTVRAQAYLLQCLVDLRLEPRWHPEFALPEQLENEIYGRVWLAASRNSEIVSRAGWNGLLLDDVEGSLSRRVDFVRLSLPGPLEGGKEATIEMPAELATKMRSDLSGTDITAATFLGLANASFLFHVPTDILDLAADAIARAEYRLESVHDSAILEQCLRGLASAASIGRNQKLGDSLFVLLRKYRRFYSGELTIDASFHIAMIASASRAEFSAWCRSVGGCIHDLAFHSSPGEETQRLHSNVLLLCHLVPELWATCGQAEAALRSVLKT